MSLKLFQYFVVARGQALTVELQPLADGAAKPALEVARLRVRDGFYAVAPASEENAVPSIQKLATDQVHRHGPTTGQGLKLAGVDETLILNTLYRPPWAHGLARIEGELVAVYQSAGRYHEAGDRAYWCRPGRYPVLDAGHNPIAELSIKTGFFWHQRGFEEWRAQGGFVQPAWASAIGVDGYGLHATASIAGVEQLFRWIPPGEFLMGSPEKEPERFDNEAQHPVTLTHDFWLADTAVTQALWQAVMGENPSYFNLGEDSINWPVEQVSWDDCQVFIQRLNKLLPLNARLPSEAEWEYVCRAGTVTPFSFGSELTTEQANYNGNVPYHRGSQGVYRSTTVDVRHFALNPWGLYQMHGNVWEWCQDWYQGDYEQNSLVDPVGPAEGLQRVLLGGSWISGGGNLRAAFRRGLPPDGANVGTGLRLALG